MSFSLDRVIQIMDLDGDSNGIQKTIVDFKNAFDNINEGSVLYYLHHIEMGHSKQLT